MTKKIFKLLAIGILILIGILMATTPLMRISNEKRSKEYARTLEGMVQELNKHFPIKLPDSDINFGSLKRVYIEDDCVVWENEIDTTYIYPDRVSLLQPESMNAGILVSGTREDHLDLVDTIPFSDEMMKNHQKCSLLYYYLFARKDSQNPFYDELMKREYSQKWIYKSPFSNRQVEFTITHDEMEQMERQCKYLRNSALQDFLKLYADRQSDVLKIASNNSDVEVEFIIEPKSFIYRYTLGENYNEDGNLPIQNLRNIKELLQQEAETDLNTIPIFYASKEIATTYNRDIVMMYRDFNHTDSISFTVYQGYRGKKIE